MMDWSGWGAAGAFAMTVGMLALVLLVVGGLALLLRPVFGGQSRAVDKSADGEPKDDDSALRIATDGHVERVTRKGVQRGSDESRTHPTQERRSS